MAIRDDRYQFIDGVHYIDKLLAAELAGITPQTLNNYRSKENPPPYHSEYKMYPLKQFGVWMREHLMFRAAQGGKSKYKELFRQRGYIHRSEISGTDSKIIGGLPGMDGVEIDITEDQDVRLKRLRADKLELEIRTRAGELIEADSVEIAFAEMISRTKMKLLGLPTSMSPLITGKDDTIEIQAIIEERVRAALEELAGDWRTEIDDEEVEEEEQ